MMKRNRMTLATLVLLLVGSLGVQGVRAQAPSDAYRNNLQEITGTARAQALGGAVGAVGADPTAVQVNPAGIALYLRPSLAGTVVVSPSNAKTNWIAKDGSPFGTTSQWSTTSGHFSYISPLVKRSPSRAININWGFIYNRDYDYKRDYELVMSAPDFGITDYMAFHANLLGKPNRTERISPIVDIARNAAFIEAYTDAASVVPEGDESRYRSLFGATLEGTNPSDGKVHLFLPKASDLRVVEYGNKDSYDFSIGMGFRDRFYLGATLSFTSHYLNRTAYHEESFHDSYNGGNYDSSLKYRTGLELSGVSVGADLGALVAIGDYGRVGVSYRFPQYASFRESYDAYGYSFNDSFGVGDKETTYDMGYMESAYSMVMPGQLTVSAMGFLGRFGFLSYDFQYRNLGRSVLYDGNSRNKLSESEFIKEDYGSEMTHRVGVELRPWHSLAVRAGYSQTGNPMKSEQLKAEPSNGLTYNAVPSGYIVDFVLPRSYQTFSAGLGFNLTRTITLDLAYVNALRTERVYPYSGDSGEIIVQEDIVNGNLSQVRDVHEMAVRGGDLKTTNHKILATLTFNF